MSYGAVLDALGDPTRRAVFERVARGPVSVGAIAETLPVTRPAVSRHLRVLREAGLVTPRRQGTRNLYALDERGLEDLHAWVTRHWDEVLARFATHVDAEEAAP
jgi:DNA-binding transcriptional ArsR family regulator